MMLMTRWRKAQLNPPRVLLSTSAQCDARQPWQARCWIAFDTWRRHRLQRAARGLSQSCLAHRALPHIWLRSTHGRCRGQSGVRQPHAPAGAPAESTPALPACAFLCRHRARLLRLPS